MDVRFLEFPNELGALVVGALVRDEETGYLTLGVACGSEPVAALRKALAEALQLQRFVAAYDDPEGGYMRAARCDGSPLAAWRADRRYASSYRSDLRDVVDYGCHLQLYLDPVVQARFEEELASRLVGEVSCSELTVGGGLDGFRPVSVDVTTPDVRAAGLCVVRVVVPGLYSNAAAGLPFLGGRLSGARVSLPLPH
jgi:ribosomal protein S12 methylthiotransferase accessory factor